MPGSRVGILGKGTYVTTRKSLSQIGPQFPQFYNDLKIYTK